MLVYHEGSPPSIGSAVVMRHDQSPVTPNVGIVIDVDTTTLWYTIWWPADGLITQQLRSTLRTVFLLDS